VQKAEGRCLLEWSKEVSSSTQNLLVSGVSQKIALCVLLQLLIIEEVTNSVLLGEVTCSSNYSVSGFDLFIYCCKSCIHFYTLIRIRGNNKDASIQGGNLLVLQLCVT